MAQAPTTEATGLSAKGLGLCFGQQKILDQLDLELKPGEIVAIVGPNGAGKSTLLRALLGLLHPSQGLVHIDGQRLQQLSRRIIAQRLAYVPQRIPREAPFSVRELVQQGRTPHSKWLRLEKSSEVDQALLHEALAALQQRPLAQLSGGEAQRVMIAAALAQTPRYLLLDEPTSALDPQHVAGVVAQLKKSAAAKVGVLFATHDLNLALGLAQRVYLLEKGRVRAQGSPQKVFSSAAFDEVYEGGLERVPFEQGFLLRPRLSPSQNTKTPPSAPGPPSTPWRRALVASLVGLAALGATLLLSPLLGSGQLDLLTALSEGSGGPSVDATIYWQLRLPRVLLAFLAGAALASAGAAFQAMLRNPLATPYTLGVAGGATLGAAAAIVIGGGFISATLGLSGAAFVGALLSLAVVYLLARASASPSSSTLLLAGIAWAIASSAMVLLLQSFAPPQQAHQLLRWMIGSVEVVGLDSLIRITPMVGVAILALWLLAPRLNLMAVDDELAATRGISLAQTRWLVFGASSLATGAVVAEVGPIAFVGLVVPHLMRGWLGADNRIILPLSALYGAIFLACADALARWAMAPRELPVGVVTALLGAPFLIAVLLSKRK